MKKLFYLLMLIFSASLSLAQQPAGGLAPGDAAPSFSGKDQQGNTITLQQQLEKGPVVVVFYRGYWCPYCNRYLKKLEDSLSLITGKQASLVAITAEKPENISKTVDKTKASYPVLFDEGLKIMQQYKVQYAVDQATIDQYKKYKIDFNEVNGSNGANLPVPAVYVIGKNGKVTYRFYNTDYTKRPSVSEIIAHL
ncbi:peroxiredoxin-like family protein [Paraflavitalea sp. CAU 1676]|uniref:peroxiredoxin-like family protein n=1 Tax=Paraflavitalea sp. CAU 1676 TaxID=3032598 RepID=UPI0023DBD4C6|nr:peroxiredoxin-like family protein [Paraflavitalea sp. CAU 1676]MDF2193682.1 peroxiredoxin-like family protein [Paraflavitalea sp. CAU 1676]